MHQFSIKISILLFFVFTMNLFAQKEANIWYFGENSGLSFNTEPPTFLYDGAINTLEGSSTFSDKDGNLLFYSDGTTVWDKSHRVSYW